MMWIYDSGIVPLLIEKLSSFETAPGMNSNGNRRNEDNQKDGTTSVDQPLSRQYICLENVVCFFHLK